MFASIRCCSAVFGALGAFLEHYVELFLGLGRLLRLMIEHNTICCMHYSLARDWMNTTTRGNLDNISIMEIPTNTPQVKTLAFLPY